jgi:hypothetical protein
VKEVDIDEAMDAVGIPVYHINSEEDIPKVLDQMFPERKGRITPIPELGIVALVEDEETVDMAPTCIACDKRIQSPADCPMEAFRMGVPIHTTCMEIVDRFHVAWHKMFGVKY